jgi:hypothetical protein
MIAILEGTFAGGRPRALASCGDVEPAATESGVRAARDHRCSIGHASRINGERPIAITWRLRVPMPAADFATASFVQ